MLVLVSGSGGGGAGWCSCWRHWTCRSCYLPTGRLAVDQHFHITPHTTHHTHSTGYTHPTHTAHWRGCVQGWPRQCGGCSDPALTTEPAQGSRRLRPGPGRRQGRRGEIFHGGTFHGRLWSNENTSIRHHINSEETIVIISYKWNVWWRLIGTCCILSGDFQVYCFRIEMEDNI